MINPELEDVENKLVFDIETGIISSDDRRCGYTIACCKLDRKEANSNRQKVWDDFSKKVKTIFYEVSVLKKHHEDKKIAKNDFENKCNERFIKLKALIGYFKEDTCNPNNEYLAFRRYIIRNHNLFSNKE